jgi:hypothetical protein
MRRKTVYRAIEGIDRSQLEAFQAGMRKRYSDEHILAELNACAVASRRHCAPSWHRDAGRVSVPLASSLYLRVCQNDLHWLHAS